MNNAIQSQYSTTSNLDARIRLHRLFSTNPYGWYSWYLDQLEVPTGSRILEIGCGPAALWQDQLARIPPSWRLILSDVSPGMVHAAQKNTQNRQPAGALHYANLDAQAIPFPNAAFDAVLANHMLYHVPNLPCALAEIRRVLKAGGQLFAATNGETNMTGLDELVERLAPAFAPRSNPQVEHWRSAFTLENGPGSLAPFFQTVRLKRYTDDLVITQAQPVIDYVLSMQRNFEKPASQEQINAFQHALEDELCARGSITIHKDVGLLIAS
jgi:ubiquinone/menaquinone biosynthesis C-methylase UbiE